MYSWGAAQQTQLLVCEYRTAIGWSALDPTFQYLMQGPDAGLKEPEQGGACLMYQIGLAESFGQISISTGLVVPPTCMSFRGKVKLEINASCASCLLEFRTLAVHQHCVFFQDLTRFFITVFFVSIRLPTYCTPCCATRSQHVFLPC